MKNLTFGGAKLFLGVLRWAEWSDLKKIEKSFYRTVVSTYRQNFSILALFGCKKTEKPYVCEK